MLSFSRNFYQCILSCVDRLLNMFVLMSMRNEVRLKRPVALERIDLQFCFAQSCSVQNHIVDRLEKSPYDALYGHFGPRMTLGIVVNLDSGHVLDYDFGFRIEYKGRSVVLSGDTRACENMVLQSQGADLLIHEANNFALLDHMAKLIGDRESKTLQALKVLAKKIQKYHTSPVQAAEIASRAKVRKLVFNHIDPPMGPYLVRNW